MTFSKYLTWDIAALLKKCNGFITDLPPHASRSLPELKPVLVKALVLWHVLYSPSIFGNDYY